MSAASFLQLYVIIDYGVCKHQYFSQGMTNLNFLCLYIRFRDGAGEILAGLIPFISVANPIPELYDAMVLSLSLLLVLLSSQMYQPMVSSLQKDEILQDIKN